MRRLARCLFLVCLPLPAGCADVDRSRGPFTAKVTLDLAQVGRPANRLLLGNNLQWVDHGDELLDRAGQFQPRMLELVRGLSPAMLRYPGGCLADTYHWANGMGNIDERRANERFFDKRKEKILFGTREFLELCRLVGAEPLITVNVATGTAEEAAAWVRLCNIERVNDREGRRLPKVRYWEIGNEPYLTSDSRPELRMSPEDFVRRARPIIAAMKQADSSIDVGLPLRSDRIGGVPATPHQGFAEAAIRGLVGEVDFLCVHNAYLPADLRAKGRDRELYWASVSAWQTIAADLAATRALAHRYRPDRALPIAVTEYNALYTLGRRTDGYIATLAGALFVADAIRTFAEENVAFANYWSLTGNGHFGAVSNRGQPRPAYHVLQAYRHILNGRLLRPAVECPSRRVPAIGFVAEVEELPLLGVVATRDTNRVHLLLINRDRADVADLELTASPVPRIRAAHLRELWCENPFDTSGRPTGWEPRAIPVPAFPMRLRLPPHSLTWLDLDIEEKMK